MSLNWKDWPVAFHSSAEVLQEIAENFEFHDDDVVVSTYHKSGTTLMQQLVSCLMLGVEETRSKRLGHRVPFIDFATDPTPPTPLEVARDLQRPRILKTHLPPAFHLRHLNRKDVGPKNVVVMRNPKDVVVSAFHHFTNSSEHEHVFPSTFPEFWRAHTLEPRKFNNFDFFDYNLSWWSFKEHPRVFIAFYEDLLRNKEENLRRLANFLEVDVTDEKIQQALEVTSFGSMQADPNVNSSLRPRSIWKNGFSFIRKGEIGDWRNHFSEEDNELFEDFAQHRLKDSGLTFTYE